MRFRGEYEHTVDPKGRVSLPAKFRKELPDDVVIVPGFGGALYVFSDDAFDAWVDSFFSQKEGGYNPRDAKDRNFRKRINASAESVAVDAAGRVKLSSKLMQRGNIGKDVTIIGDDDHIEIWNRAAWNEFEDDTASLDEFLEA